VEKFLLFLFSCIFFFVQHQGLHKSDFDLVPLLLVNNAAIIYDTWQSAVNADLDVVNQALTTNLYGPWKLSQVCIPLMKRNKYGRIVNVSSGAGSLYYMTSGSPAYNVSKAALNAFSRILAADLHGTGIMVNSVDPGWVATDMSRRGGRQ
jgi:NAD(P)-dependent dehydrogenase (short-subunit alcohol dehydrogenase family)